jgi:acyl dehydratase
MSIDYDKLLHIEIPDVDQQYSARDTILYALGLGFAYDPLNEDALAFCYEKSLRVVPTLPLVLAHPGFWMRDLDTGIDSSKVVHGEQQIELHKLPAASGHVVSKTQVVEIADKGVGRGAVVTFERQLYDSASRELLATMRQANFCRADGGFGGPCGTPRAPWQSPTTAPDHIVDLPTRPEMALLYRLSADLNPLHVEPAVARAAGFARPILHGLATLGVACHAILKSVCGYRSERLRSLAARFFSPVYPGETIRTELWQSGEELQFRALVPDRDVLVLTAGHARLREA